MPKPKWLLMIGPPVIVLSLVDFFFAGTSVAADVVGFTLGFLAVFLALVKVWPKVSTSRLFFAASCAISTGLGLLGLSYLMHDPRGYGLLIAFCSVPVFVLARWRDALTSHFAEGGASG